MITLAGPGRRWHGDDRERGSASLWVLGACVLLAGVTTVLVLFATAVFARHRAESAADLAALAAAGRIGVGTDSCAAAAAVATANGTELVGCRLHLDADGRSGQVTVRVRMAVHLAGLAPTAVTASARAARLPAA